MRIEGNSDESRPVRSERVELVEQQVARSWRLASGTLACPGCDAPVAPAGTMAPADAISCPVCDRSGAVRDFLSLAAPTRPARVEVRLVPPARLTVSSG